MGTGLPGFVEAILFFAGFFAVGAVVCAPQMLAEWFWSRGERAQKEARQQAEIMRKVAIAEAAAEARKRGEPFVPPADYDR